MIDVLHPHAVEAERALLGSIMIDSRILPLARQRVRAADFWRDDHRRVFRLLCAMDDQGDAIDIVTVPQRIIESPAEFKAGLDIAYIIEIPEATPSSAAWPTYASIVVEKAQRRAIMDAAIQTTEAAATMPIDELRTKALAAMADIRVDYGTPTERWICDSVDEVEEEEARARSGGGVAVAGFGISALDQLLGGGLVATEYVLLYGLPGHMKTTVALNAALATALGNGPTGIPQGVAIYTLEQRHTEITRKLACIMSGVDSRVARAGALRGAELARYDQARRDLRDLPIRIIDDWDLNRDTLRASMLANANLLARQPDYDGISLCIVDYMQNLEPAEKGPSYEQYKADSRAMKPILREINACGLNLAQLGEVKGARPQPGDLAGSKQYRRDAEVMISAFFPLKQRRQTDGWENRFEVYVQKSRHGGTGMCRLFAEPACGRFRDLTGEELDAWMQAAKRRGQSAPAAQDGEQTTMDQE